MQYIQREKDKEILSMMYDAENQVKDEQEEESKLKTFRVRKETSTML